MLCRQNERLRLPIGATKIGARGALGPPNREQNGANKEQNGVEKDQNGAFLGSCLP